MGCQASKQNGAADVVISKSMSMSRDVSKIPTENLLNGGRGVNVNRPERLFRLLEKALYQQRKPKTAGGGMDVDALDDLTVERQALYTAAIEQINKTAGAKNSAARYVHPKTKQTPLHLACRLVDVDQNQVSAKELCRVMDALLKSYPEALETKDCKGHVPLHYAVAPNHFYADESEKKSGNDTEEVPLYTGDDVDRDDEDWRARGIFAQHLFHSNLKAAHSYWQQSDVVFDEQRSSSQKDGSFQTEIKSTGGCSPLYRVLQTLPDDFDRSGPTVEYIKVLLQASYWYDEGDEAGKDALESNSNHNNMAGVGNVSDGDKPLGLLYRRFTRQFDISEMFFAGDNSREEVVRHREKYKFAAGNTWKIIEALLKPPAQHVQDSLALSPASATSRMQQQQEQPDWGIVHRAVQMETPPDLLRYIVETNAQDLTKVDARGNLPLHYAAMVKPPKPTTSDGKSDTTHFPSFYSKYVADELLYKFPEGAGMKNADGKFPLTLAVTSGKQWIGGGIKSLYDAYPKALGQIDLKKKQHLSLRRALSMNEENNDENNTNNGEQENPNATAEDEYKETGPTSDEDLLQQVTTAATNDSEAPDGIVKDEHHDAIMLVQKPDVDCREVAIAMWAHEEDAGVQMLGCCAIARLLEESNKNDGVDSEASILTDTTLRTALTATASVVNAMKAHPNEMIVQEKACAALQLLAPADGRREVSMVASGAVASVVAAMQAHVGDPNVQEEACAAIAAIVKHGGGDRATVVASVSGVTAILNAIAAHPISANVQKEGLKALWHLTNFDASDASMPELPRAQTEPLLAQAKESFPDVCNELVEKLMDRMTKE